MMTTQRIGIYAGTFDPIHAGHIAFALQALEQAKLDKIYFLPERRPRHKPSVEHFAHRVAMIKQASLPYQQFYVLESVEVSFTIKRTLPMLQQKFKHAQLVFLFGSDAVAGLPDWPYAKQLLTTSELVIAARQGDDTTQLQTAIASWPHQPQAAVMLTSYAPSVSSSLVRAALRARQPAAGLLQSVARYSDHHWLYVSVS
ncbi:MAG: adenylyltransferase/cytidyltransferase family protein [Patescibacteria group bacterium]|nr:adenylyltransferase/cytidyltransferase family protein [Patescibacteria group bacterium]